MATKIAFVPLLNKVQEHISVNYAASLSDSRKFGQLKPYIEKYLRDHGYTVDGLTMPELADKLYCEMAEYSVLTPYLGREDIEVEKGYLNHLQLRFENEIARHKLLDILGDLALLGRRIKGHVQALRPGHYANTQMAQQLEREIANKK
jgi:UDP-3-O-[3-hydroxymyristoyl] N-acetylglucosamine deacetylase/3-hydroxyacyl-[acyl-carrier-protein] dehydratase